METKDEIAIRLYDKLYLECCGNIRARIDGIFIAREEIMSQDNVLKLLEKTKRWMLTKEISEKLGITPSNVLRALNHLKKEGLVIDKIYSKLHCAKLWRIVWLKNLS